MNALVFINNKTEAKVTYLIKRLSILLEPMVDHVCEDLHYYKPLEDYYGKCFIYQNDNLEMVPFQLWEQKSVPDFIMYVTSQTQDIEWDIMLDILTHTIIYGKEVPTLLSELLENEKTVYQSMLDLFPKLLIVEEQSSVEIPNPNPIPTEYEYHEIDIPNADIKICEIRVPNVDRPFTLILHQFSIHGYKKLFTDLYSLSCWGVYQNNTFFLHKLWDHLQMQGNCNIEQLIQERKKDFEMGDQYPIIYRYPADQVKEYLTHLEPIPIVE